jgi:hypothetical protein
MTFRPLMAWVDPRNRIRVVADEVLGICLGNRSPEGAPELTRKLSRKGFTACAEPARELSASRCSSDVAQVLAQFGQVRRCLLGTPGQKRSRRPVAQGPSAAVPGDLEKHGFGGIPPNTAFNRWRHEQEAGTRGSALDKRELIRRSHPTATRMKQIGSMTAGKPKATVLPPWICSRIVGAVRTPQMRKKELPAHARGLFIGRSSGF